MDVIDRTWKTVRVFISSTFLDMQAERDYLVRFVFPRLREELDKWRIHFIDVDLRWGVTSEQDALAVCWEIIDESRPRFLCMLGGRYGWVPPGNTHSITADEIHYGVLARTLEDRGFAYFYFRDDAATATMVETTPGEFREPHGSGNQHKLAALKQAIIAASLNPFTYPAQWDNESRRLTDLKQFGDRVYADLLASIKSDPALRDRSGTVTSARPDEFAEENVAMDMFVEERSERFVLGSREAVLNELLDHARAIGGAGYVCLTGAPGSGKSALLAYLSQHSTLNNQPSTVLIRHFVGASPDSTDVRRTLRRLCHELKAGCPDITTDIPDNPERLRTAFLDFLRQACEHQRIVILLDAVNKFDPTASVSGLHWLPDDLPITARVVLSAPDGTALEELRRRRCKPREIEVKSLTEADGEAIIEQFCGRYRKRFEPDQRAALLAKADAVTPLYLLAALEEIRTLGTYEQVSQRIAELPATTQDLFAWILERLENDDGFRDASGQRVGRVLISRFAALVGASRYGLSQRELLDLLDREDSQGNLVALLHLLRPYLMRRGALLTFYHGQFRAAAHEKWLSTAAQRERANAQLACYFRDQADPDKNKRWMGKSKRAFLELPFHLVRSDADELAQLLLHFGWLQAKACKHLVAELIDDYDEVLRALPSNHRQRDLLSIWRHFLRSNAHLIAERPRDICTIACNHTDSGPVVESAEKWLAGAGKRTAPWLRLTRGRIPYDATRICRAILQASLCPVTSVVLARSELIAVGDKRGQIHAFDMITGRRIACVSAHDGPVKALAISGDGHNLVSGGLDGRIFQWDAKALGFVRELAAHRDRVNALLPLAEHFVASASSDRTVRVYDLLDGSLIATPFGHGEEVNALACLRKNQLASCCGDRSVSDDSSLDNDVRVWNWRTGNCIRVLQGHTRAVVALCSISDEQFASASHDGTLRIWDNATGNCTAIVDCEVGAIRELQCDRTAKLVVAVGKTGRVSVVDFMRGALSFQLPDRGSACTTSWVSPGGSHAMVGYDDHLLTVWDLQTKKEVGRLIGHLGPTTQIIQDFSGNWWTSSTDGTVRQWDAHCLTVMTDLADKIVRAVSVSPRLAGGVCSDGSLRIVDIPTGDLLSRLDNLRTSASWRIIAPTPDGRLIIGSNQSVGLFDFEQGRFIWEDPTGWNQYDEAMVVGAASILLAGTEEVAAWNLNDGEEFWKAKVNMGCVNVISPFGTGQALIGAGSSWKLVSPECIVPEWGRNSPTVADSLHDLYKRQMEEDLLTLVDLKTQRLWTLARGGNPVTAIVVSEHGWGASGHADGKLKFWKTDTFELIHELDGHRDRVNALATLTAEMLISAGRDDTLKIWNPLLGKCRAVLSGHQDSVNDVVSASPSHVISISGSSGNSVDASVRLWDIDDGACESVLVLPCGGRCLLGPFDAQHFGVLLGNGNLFVVKLETTI